MKRRALIPCVLGLGLALPSCASHLERNTSPSEPCALLPGTAVAGGPVVFALRHAVDPDHAPLPRNGSEQLLFRHFYETLLRIDCTGRIVPGLARSWESRAGGAEWLFTLRDGARFWDGTPLHAGHVITSWRHLAGAAPHGTTLPWEGPGAAMAIDDQHLRVVLTEPRQNVPVEFAEPDFAIVGAVDFSGWPLGSGVHRPSGPTLETIRGNAAQVITGFPARATTWTVLRFLFVAGVEARSLLEAPVDVLITDRIPADEASHWPEFEMRLLPWETTYVLTSASARRLEASREAFPPDRRDALAHDVVRGVARGAVPPTWWGEGTRCSLAFAPGTLPAPEPRVVFDTGDIHARALAERIVALSVDPLRAAGLEAWPFATSLRAGGDLLYVLALPSRVISPCGEIQSLLEKAPWLSGRWISWSAPSIDPSGPSFEKHLLPLVETRPILMARRGLTGIDIGADGTLWLDGIGWHRAEDSP